MCADVAVQAFYFSKNRHAGLFPRTSVKQGYRVKKSTENKKLKRKPDGQKTESFVLLLTPYWTPQYSGSYEKSRI